MRDDRTVSTFKFEDNGFSYHITVNGSGYPTIKKRKVPEWETIVPDAWSPGASKLGE